MAYSASNIGVTLKYGLTLECLTRVFKCDPDTCLACYLWVFAAQCYA